MPARLRALLAVLALAAFALVPLAPAPAVTAPKAAAWPSPAATIVAHRCNGSGYTEETVVACVRAAATGATTLDVDVRFASTGTPVALHDPDLGLFGAPTVLITSLGWTPAAQYVSPEGQNLATLRQIRERIPLDVFGVDFDVDAGGKLIFYEANATMNLISSYYPADVGNPKAANEQLRQLFSAYLKSLAQSKRG